jgi:hypothetical protein
MRTEHNLEVGGAPHSEHLLGMTADIAIPGASLQRMYELAVEVPQFAEGGIGVYDINFLHVDVRERRAFWARVHGSYVDVRRLVREPQVLARADETEVSVGWSSESWGSALWLVAADLPITAIEEKQRRPVAHHNFLHLGDEDGVVAGVLRAV